MNTLLLSKKFIPTYFIATILVILLYRAIGNTWFETILVSFPCFIVGIMSTAHNFGKKAN